MSLQFIIGSSGAGKSYFAYERVIRESMEHPERNYYIIVPEQFTMQTQKTLVEMHPGKGILNIDILSFERLAYRVFEETGGDNRKVLEDTGKSMVLQKMVQQHRKELAYLGSQMNKPGYLDEVKSLVSEFMQYDIREENLAEMKEKAKDQPLLEMKLKDVGILYQSFREFLKGHYMTGEEVMDAVGDIRDAFIREAAPPPASYRKQREFPWTGAVAACLALMIVGSTFFLSQMNMGDGATGSGGASAVTEDTAEVGESGGTVNGAADGTDDSEPETAAITVTVDGTVYVQAGGVGRHPEACPEGFSYAGEAELPDTGELCPYYADPERPGQIYVYQSCWDEGTGTTYMAYVRYEAETTN